MSLKVGTLDELPAGQLKTIDVNGMPIVLARVGEQVYACHAMCSHQGGPLGDGRLTGARLSCPWHGWMFDVKTGDCLMPARGGRVPTFPVRVDGNDIFLEIP